MSSRTYVAKPGQLSRQNTGRGRGLNGISNQPNTRTPGRDRVHTMQGGSDTRYPGVNQDQAMASPPGDSQPNGVQSRMEKKEAYTLIRPNEKKRAEITEKARQEELRYKQHKEQRRISYVSYVGSVGGSEISVPESRQRFQQQQNRRKLETWEKIHERKATEKSLENAEIERKKLEARRKAEQNERFEKKRAARIQEDHRRKNDEFLRRLEQNPKKPSAAARNIEPM